MPRESTNEDNLKLLDSLIDNWENETIEFKEASNDFDTDRIGRYVSALSNEANLADLESGWLVFGVKNKTRAVVGTGYGTDPRRIDSLCVSSRGFEQKEHRKLSSRSIGSAHAF